MHAAKPPAFRRRALDLFAQGKPVGQVARDFGISESCLRRWMSLDDVDGGRKEGLTSSERKELIWSCAGGTGSWRWNWRS